MKKDNDVKEWKLGNLLSLNQEEYPALGIDKGTCDWRDSLIKRPEY